MNKKTLLHRRKPFAILILIIILVLAAALIIGVEHSRSRSPVAILQKELSMATGSANKQLLLHQLAVTCAAEHKVACVTKANNELAATSLPNSPNVLATEAASQAKLGNKAVAIADYEQAIALAKRTLPASPITTGYIQTLNNDIADLK
jgi:hypothetical protein